MGGGGGGEGRGERGEGRGVGWEGVILSCEEVESTNYGTRTNCAFHAGSQWAMGGVLLGQYNVITISFLGSGLDIKPGHKVVMVEGYHSKTQKNQM